MSRASMRPVGRPTTAKSSGSLGTAGTAGTPTPAAAADSSPNVAVRPSGWTTAVARVTPAGRGGGGHRRGPDARRRRARGAVEGVDRVGPAGELVEQQRRPGVLQHDVDVVEPGVDLLGDDLRHRRGDALADLGPR